MDASAELPLAKLRYRDQIVAFLGCVLDQKDRQYKKGESKALRAIVLHPESPIGGAAKNLIGALRDPNFSDVEIWQDICWLSEEYGLFKITEQRKKRAVSDPIWAHAKLIFRDAAEDVMRKWLDRPLSENLDESWRELIEAKAGLFDAPEVALFWKRPPLPAGFSDYSALLSCWCSVGSVLSAVSSISWRQLSARCFNGDSKFLDAESSQSLLRRLYPNLSQKINVRPVLLHIYLPEDIRQVLIVENQDTFTEMADLQLQATALVYGMGYRAGTSRVRQPNLANFSLYGCLATPHQQELFERWWTGQVTRNWPVYFWGDLDHAGMDIAASLRVSFPQLICWRPGYSLMLAALEAGGGHTPEQAGKGGQREVGAFGCEYADKVLLPAIKSHGRFVDQEFVDIPMLSDGEDW